MVKASEARSIVDEVKKEAASWNIDSIVDEIVTKYDGHIIAHSASGGYELGIWWSEVYDMVFAYIKSSSFPYLKDVKFDMTHGVIQRLKDLYTEAGYETELVDCPIPPSTPYLIDTRRKNLIIRW